MARDTNYFKHFIEMMDCACNCAEMLKTILQEYDYHNIKKYKEEIHLIEHSADLIKHTIMEQLMKEFLPPIERQDIVNISHLLDEICDCVEEVVEMMYMNDIKSCRPDAVEMASAVLDATNELHALIIKFEGFKKPENLMPHIIKVNTLEEVVDNLYFEAMRKLSTDGNAVAEVIGWRDIYTCLEDCSDACEKVADAVEEVLMKNS
ncbi:MAG TPA: DUF47 domain-containing protein [Clostridiales bacterium]|jgi:hypothetical protein|nr:DUF47 domain-containing protein [Clostridiales bacterium]HBE13656.1 DUF47 domain-containing protein [Clostridiales bacterium]HCG36053.1 DUF47 domain-containing protein [Clostridiales bacterium]